MKAAKAIVAAVGTVVTAATAALADNVLSIDEWGTLIAVVIAAGGTIWGVYQVSNADPDA